LITFRSRLFVVIYTTIKMGTKRWDIQWTTETCAIVLTWFGSPTFKPRLSNVWNATLFSPIPPQPRRNEKKWILFFKGNATFFKFFF
jgi:hypothetical protein